ncbi:MAG: UvrD-helicase domain-containing protein [Gammaproteobacteria bacterium]|nr:UvrD-helicase domain-containing protein [Gammaproteobacteria bacterium]
MSDPAIVDAAQRAQALDVTRSFIVQAPAGSGKTELLTQRYLCLLANVANPEEICAITFTRKAAAEMRNRVLNALDRAHAPEPSKAHERQTWQLARAALAQDRARDWQLAQNPNRLRIQTFDSLAHALARQLPLLSEFGAPPVTTEQAELYYRSAARATLRQLDDDVLGPHLERLLRHRDNRMGQIEDLLTAMLARRDQWLRHALASPRGDALEAALRTAVEEHLQTLLEHCDRHQLERLCTLATWAAANLKIPGDAPWFERETLPQARWEELPAWLALADLLLTAKGELRKRWDAKLGFPAPSGARDTQREQRYRQAKDEAAALTERLRDDDTEAALWRMLKILPTSTLAGGQHAVLESLLYVLLHAAQELILAFREGGEVDFAETQTRALRALGSPDSPTDLALALDYRLQHLLVDEFQDTSSSQYQLLSTLTANWTIGDGRTLFAVGDPMQSIYRFREAEVGLYLAARENGIGELHLEPLTLEVNFRSTRAVVDWVNACFTQIFPRQVDIARGAVTYAAASAFDPTTAYQAVTVHPFVGRDDAAEAYLVADLVQQALASDDSGSIAVLGRARSHLHAIALALDTAGVRYQAVDIRPLGEQAVVQDLYHLTRALLHPADRLAWLVVLRAPWLGLAVEDLLRIAEQTPACVLTRLHDSTLCAQLSADGQQRVERLLGVVDSQLPARGRRPLRQWVEGIWLRLGGLAAAGVDAADDAQAFLALLDNVADAGGLVDFDRLDSAIARLYAAPDSHADGRVQLMTMHKAKGLEFDTVILPALGRNPPPPDAELLYWLERPDRNGKLALLMAPIRAADDDNEPISAYLRELDRDKSRLEIARLLYVAATRARRCLHLIGHVNVDKQGGPGQPARDSLLEQLWPQIARVYSATDSHRAAADIAIPRIPLQRLAADWSPATPPEDLAALASPEDGATDTAIDFLWAGDTARHVGTLVHRHLERIATHGVDTWDTARIDTMRPAIEVALRNLGVAADELADAVDKTRRALQRTLTDDTGRWLLGNHAEARSEWALTRNDHSAQRFVIDRSFVDEQGVRWIVDYKTGEHLGDDVDAFIEREHERYRAQLENYARIVRVIDDRPIRLALYFPLFPALRAWDFDG